MIAAHVAPFIHLHATDWLGVAIALAAAALGFLIASRR